MYSWPHQRVMRLKKVNEKLAVNQLNEFCIMIDIWKERYNFFPLTAMNHHLRSSLGLLNAS